MKRKFLALFPLLAALSAHATDRYVDTAGVDSSDCSAAPCLTLQYAIDQSLDGDNINVNAGTYAVSGVVNVNKSLNLYGHQANNDARFRSGAETILSNSQGLSISANNVVINGFTIQDSNISAFTGYGVWMNPGVDGTHIVNNIFTNNIVGLGLANLGANQALIQYNFFYDNNQPGAASGTAIYTDQYVGGLVSNVLISDNYFDNHANTAIAFSSEDGANPAYNININNNNISYSGRGIFMFNTTYSFISNNSFSNFLIPTDGGSSVALGIYGGVSNLTVSYNDFYSGIGYGIRIANLSGALPANSYVSIHTNNISGYALAGMYVENAPASPEIGFSGPAMAFDYATCNFWGQTSGPEHPANPSGTGDVISGDVIFENFSPWLIEPAPFGACGLPPEPQYISVSKVFAPYQIYKGERTTLVITLINDSDNDAILTAPLLDILPFGLEIKGNGTTTCDGELMAQKNGRSIILTEGIIPRHGFCNISVSVKALTTDFFTSTLPVHALHTDQGSNAYEASATLNVVNKNHHGF